MNLTISTLAISDHMSRLYDEWGAKGNTFFHVDGEESGVITVHKEGKKTSNVTMDRNAVIEFLADMAYQVEVTDDPSDRVYRGQCKRAWVAVKKQLATE